MPLFSGGLVDAWPNWALEAMHICRSEFAAVRALLQHDEAKKKPQKGGTRG